MFCVVMFSVFIVMSCLECSVCIVMFSVLSVMSSSVCCHLQCVVMFRVITYYKLAVVPVKVKANMGSCVIETYSFLDPGSATTFCTEKLMEQLSVRGTKTVILLRSMGHEKLVKTHSLGSLDGNNFIELPAVFTQNAIPVSQENIPTEMDKILALPEGCPPILHQSRGCSVEWCKYPKNNRTAESDQQSRRGALRSPDMLRIDCKWTSWQSCTCR